LQTLDNTHVYTLTNIDRDPSLKPNIKSIRGIKSQHCFQFVDENHVDCCVMCGDAWHVHHIPFTSGSQTRSSCVNDVIDKEDDDDEKEEEEGIEEKIQNGTEDGSL